MAKALSPSDVLAFHAHESARVAVVSLRGAQREVWRALPFEFEDTIARLDEADVVGPGAVVNGQLLSRRLVQHWRRLTRPAQIAPAQAPLRTTGRRYDLLFVPIGDLNELSMFEDLKPWLSSSRLRVAWVVELWSRSIANNPRALRLLKQFDMIAVGAENSVEPLQRATGVPCFYLPAGVDVTQCMPNDLRAERPIDVYQMGRRADSTHRALLNLARERDWYYLFDTSWSKETDQPVEHRALLADTIKRTRFFIANRAKVDAPQQTGGQHEVGFRMFEGSAGGTVMMGETPQTPSFQNLFGWEDAVIPMPFGSTHIGDLIDSLVAQPQRLQAIRARNVQQALLRHDWAYRWRAVLERAGLKPLPGLVAREAQLAALAERIGHEHTDIAAASSTGARILRLPVAGQTGLQMGA
jgi:hypothetical protein